MYVHIFTDDKNPQELLKRCEETVNKANIAYGTRTTDNRYDLNVLDDFFAITQFDCLIRGDSNFSIMASKLACHKIVLAPKGWRWEEQKLIIPEHMVCRKNECAALLKNIDQIHSDNLTCDCKERYDISVGAD